MKGQRENEEERERERAREMSCGSPVHRARWQSFSVWSLPCVQVRQLWCRFHHEFEGHAKAELWAHRQTNMCSWLVVVSRTWCLSSATTVLSAKARASIGSDASTSRHNTLARVFVRCFSRGGCIGAGTKLPSANHRH